ncbi:MAG: helix-turn-helix transcriptional regulator [Solirubrobacterales bacterium]
MDLARRFGANLNAARRASGLSQERLAFRAGLHRTEIGLLEHGRRIPRIDTVAKLARAMEIGPGELLVGLEITEQELARSRRQILSNLSQS